jgi:hypothetical protein
MLADVLKQLRALPYSDMIELAKALEEHLDGAKGPPVNCIADALAEVAKSPIQQSELTDADHKLLQQIFSRRRSISIKAMNGGFQIDLQSLNGNVMTQDLRVGITQLIDTIVAARALKGG